MLLLNQLYGKSRRKLVSLQRDRAVFRPIERLFRKTEDFFWGLRKITVIDCFGDSHAAIFGHLNGDQGIVGVRFRAISVRGATAFGMANPNSMTNSFNIFKEWLARTPVSNRVLFMMGEVDAGFLIWLRAEKYRSSPESVMREALENYYDFLDSVREVHPALLICSAPLPTIRDGEAFGEVADARNSIKATQLQRTELTLRFNGALREWADQRGIDFIDLDSSSIDPETGLIDEVLMNSRKIDHHYDEHAFISLLLSVMEASGLKEKLQAQE